MSQNESYNQAYLRSVHLFADDVLTLSAYRHNVSYWSVMGVDDDGAKPASRASYTETSCTLTQNQEACKQRVNDQIPAFVEICDVILPSASSGHKVFQPYPTINTSIPCPREQYFDADACLLKECSTASTAPISADPMSTSSQEVADFFITKDCGMSCQMSSARTIFSEVSRCSTSSSSTSTTQVVDLMGNVPLSRADDKHSTYSAESSSSSSEDSSSTSTIMSGESLSTLLESDDSSESSLFSDDSFSKHEHTVTSNHVPRSMKLRKSFERRDRDLRRLSLGNKGYRIYLSRQEELVQQHAFNRYADPKTLNQKDISANYQVEESCAISERKHSITYNVQRRLLFERYHTAPGVATLLIYIIAHVSCYDALHQLFMNSFFNFSYHRLAYFLSFVVGIALLRLTGSIWNWGTASLYEAVKFDLHNKLRLGDFDIKFIRWINKRKRLQQFLSIIGIYLCFISVEFALSELLLPTVCRVNHKVIEELPSQTHGIETWLSRVLESNGFHPSYNTNDLSNALERPFDFLKSDEDDQCLLNTEVLEEADSAYLYSKLSYSSFFSLYGWDAESKLISSNCQIMLSLTNAFISVTFLYVMGIGFWDD